MGSGKTFVALDELTLLRPRLNHQINPMTMPKISRYFIGHVAKVLP
jgi:hypothetical protein